MDTVSNRRLAAVLSADIVGYSRMMGEDEAGALEALRRFRDTLFTPAVETHGGRIVKSLGDGWLVVFDSAASAVRSALAVQDDTTSSAQAPVRIGVHIGDVVFEEGDIYGDGVNVAARLQALSPVRGVAISDPVWSSLDGTLRDRFGDFGPQRLKNIAAPLRVWAFGEGGLSGSTEAAAGYATADPPSIAIAAFAAPGGDSGHESLAEGLADDLATELSRFRSIEVVGLGGDATARYLLGGAVRGDARRLRVTAHLTYTPTGRRLWSERWELSPDDLLAVQDTLTEAVVGRVSSEIYANERILVASRPTHAMTARELSLHANAIVSSGRVDALDEAAALIARAVALEPGNAEAHVQKALVAYNKACSAAWPVREELKLGLDAAQRALGLDPRLASAAVMASVIHGLLGETDRALDAAGRVQTLNPNAWGAPHARCVARAFAPPEWVSDPESHAEALTRDADRTLSMATNSPYRAGHLFYRGLGLLLRHEASDLAEAAAALDRSAAEPGATWWPSLFLALVDLRRGLRRQAEDHISEARERGVALSVSAVEALFGASYVATRWGKEIGMLQECGLPRD